MAYGLCYNDQGFGLWTSPELPTVWPSDSATLTKNMAFGALQNRQEMAFELCYKDQGFSLWTSPESPTVWPSDSATLTKIMAFGALQNRQGYGL